MSSDSLFNLINSLTKGEKKMVSIKVESSKNSKNKNFLTLFKIYSQFEVYHKDEIRKRLNQANIKSTAVVKHQLYHLILRIIKHNYSDRRKLYEVRELIDHADILVEKNLLKESQKLLLKAQKIAEEFLLHSELKIILKKRTKVSYLLRDIEGIKYHISETSNRLINLQKKSLIIEKLNSLVYEAQFLLISNFRYANQFNLKKIEDFKKDFEIQKNELSGVEDNEIKMLLLTLESFVCFTDNRLSESYKCRKEILNILEYNPHIIEDDPSEWARHNRVLLASLYLSHDYQKAEKEEENMYNTIKQLDFSSSNKRSKAAVDMTVDMTLLSSSITRGDFSSSASMVEDMETRFLNNEILRSYDINQIARFNFMHSFFGQGNFKKALWHSNQIINRKLDEIRLDVQVYTRYFNLIIHFELGNFELI